MELAATTRPAISRDVLTPARWVKLERSIDQGLAWLANQQQEDGAFPTLDTGQPAVTALCVLAFLSRGHMPGEGPHGRLIDRGIDYILSSQHPDGLIARHYPSMPYVYLNPSHTANYNHAIGGLCLTEAYGMTKGETNRRIRATVESALPYAAQRRPQPKRLAREEGGWRYENCHEDLDSDLSVSSWYLLFFRSARNAGFDVPTNVIDDGLGFVRRCYDPQRQCFAYGPGRPNISRALTGAGILSLSLGGQHQTAIAREAGQWMLRHPFTNYGAGVGAGDAFFFSTFYSSQAMFQLGGEHWSRFYPALVRTLLACQQPDGSWPPEVGRGARFGATYSTTMAVLALNVPNQLLPIFQR